ncbi:retrovirus-related pol polyprotein from transposon TNT 1-94, partial [Tanacetum coccineum]
LAKDGLARGIPKFKFKKDHLCSACALGKSKKSSHQPKAEDTNQEKLYLLHMDLCGLMHVDNINGKKYILVIIDDYSRFTWVKFLRSKDEAHDAIIKCIKNIQVRLNSTVRNLRTDNGTEFVNQTVYEFYENVSITHQTSIARTPQQNGIVERQNWTLVEAARTMFIILKTLLFMWAEAINTACYTQNRSLIHLRYNKTPHDLIHDKKPDLLFLYVFGSLCYPTNDSEDLGKLNAKDDIAMTSEQFNSGPELQVMILATSSSELIPNLVPQQPFNPPMRNDLDRLFQPMFDEYFNPPSSAVSLVRVAVALRSVEIAATPSSITIDQDAPSSSTSSTNQQKQSSIISQGVEEPILNAHFNNPCHEPLYDVSTSQESSSNVQSSHSSLELIGKWTKDHPLANVIEPENFKEAMSNPHGLRRYKKKFINLKDYKFKNWCLV